MNDSNVIADLKQFISAEIRQQTAHLATKEDLRTMRDDLSQKIEDTKTEILEAVGDSLSTYASATDEQLQKHDHRITRLEHKAA